MAPYCQPSFPAPVPPRLVTDDGDTVTLDLHGQSVREAVETVRRACAEAARRGRRTLRVVHGSSTSGDAHRSTIRNELRRLLERGELGPEVTSYLDLGDVTLVSLHPPTHRDPTTITAFDLR